MGSFSRAVTLLVFTVFAVSSSSALSSSSSSSFSSSSSPSSAYAVASGASLFPLHTNQRSLKAVGSDRAALLSAKYDAAGKAAKIRDHIPCLKEGHCTFDPNDQDYFVGLLMWLVPGFLIALLTPIIGLVVCISRTCCNCCNGQEKLEGYTKKERWGSLGVCLVMVITSVVFSTMGFYSNAELSNAMQGKDQGFSTIAKDFLGDAIVAINGVRTPIVKAQGSTPQIAVAVDAKLAGTDILSTGVGVLAGDIAIFTSLLANSSTIAVPAVGLAPASSIACALCSTLSNSKTGIQAEVDAQTGPALASMKSIVDSSTVYLANAVDAITQGLSEAITQIDKATVQFNTMRVSAQKAIDEVIKYDSSRNSLMIFFFLFPLISFVLVLLGGCFGKPIAFGVNTYFVMLTIFCMAVMWGLHMPIALLITDSCDYINLQEQDFINNLDPDAGKILNACLLDQSLVEAFNLTSQLQFRDQMSFPPIPQIADSFTFAQLYVLRDAIFALNLVSFGGSPVEKALLAFNSIPSPATNFSLADINTVDVSGNLALEAGRDGVKQAEIAEAKINATLLSFRSEMSKVINSSETFKGQVAVVQVQLDSIQGLVDPLFATVDEVTEKAKCGFLGDAYQRFKTTLCTTGAAACTFLALATFLITIVSFPLMIDSMRAKKKYKNKEEDNDLNNDFRSADDSIAQQQNTKFNDSSSFSSTHQSRLSLVELSTMSVIDDADDDTSDDNNSSVASASSDDDDGFERRTAS